MALRAQGSQVGVRGSGCRPRRPDSPWVLSQPLIALAVMSAKLSGLTAEHPQPGNLLSSATGLADPGEAVLDGGPLVAGPQPRGLPPSATGQRRTAGLRGPQRADVRLDDRRQQRGAGRHRAGRRRHRRRRWRAHRERRLAGWPGHPAQQAAQCHVGARLQVRAVGVGPPQPGPGVAQPDRREAVGQGVRPDRHEQLPALEQRPPDHWPRSTAVGGWRVSKRSVGGGPARCRGEALRRLAGLDQERGEAEHGVSGYLRFRFRPWSAPRP